MGSDLPLRILFVVPYAPSRIRTRPFHLIQALAAHGQRVTLATLWTSKQEAVITRELAKQLEELVDQKISTARSLWNCLCACPGSGPLQASYSWSPALARRILELANSKRFDVIHVEHLRGARYGLLLKRDMACNWKMSTPVIWDSVDCISELFRSASIQSQTFRSRLAARSELSRTEMYEGWLTTCFDRILVTSEADRRALVKRGEQWYSRQGLDPGDWSSRRLSVVPNGVDLEYFAPKPEPREPLTLVITGKMSYHANVTAVVRFVKDVMPLVWAKWPQTRLWLVGKDPAPEVRKLGVPWRNDQPSSHPQRMGGPRVYITGTVEDIRPFLRKATLAVAPIQYGVGIQNKVLEAMACATPLVATPQAVRPIRVQAGQHLLLAQNGRELAEAIVFLLRNPQMACALGQEGRKFVEQHHNWSAIAGDLTQIYKEAAGTESRRICQPVSCV